MKKLRVVLSTANLIILMVMATGNTLFGIGVYFQEFKKTNCIREAIYHNATENEFVGCIIDTGLFSVYIIAWILLQFILILISIVIISFTEGIGTKK